ncbi:hypothetical protein D915_004058 [Fasciola hepatica]|uniref:G-protein coupled receptors family 1 profile domain-containing protein n=1 Tax=Fasciola hepatica TaxID=6192 RepID=A0A4E0RVH4_FASHE|nr:hypothetical protein D915_004058 [Fasciola hepatica]
MNSSSAVCDHYSVGRTLIGVLGLFNIILGLIGSLIWLLYLNTAVQHKTSNIDLIELAEIRQQPNPSKSEWPSCPFRQSTRLYMMAMFCMDLLGLFTSNLRFTVLLFTNTDMRLRWGDPVCRLQILLAYMAGDLSTWFQVTFCIERFLILLLPTWSYSRDRARIMPAIVLIVVTTLITFGVNTFILIPVVPVCAAKFHNLTVTWFKMVYTFLIPLPLLFLSTTGVLILLIARVGTSRLALCLARLIGIRNKQTSVSLSEAIFASKMMVINGLITLTASTAILLNTVIHASYCCFLTTHQICTLDDLQFSLISLCFYTAICIRSYILIFSSKRVRTDVKQLVKMMFSCTGCSSTCIRT